MQKYSDITFKYLKAQKRRTILTLIGIILSVALISSMGTMFYSMTQSEINNEKKNSGDFYFGYKDANTKLYKQLENNPKVESVAVKIKGVEKSILDKNSSLSIEKYNKSAFDTLPIALKEGKIPTKENEILIEKWVLDIINKNIKINDKVKLNFNGENKEFTLVGILQDGINAQYIGESKAITFVSEISKSEKLQLFIKLKDGVDIDENIPDFSKMTTPNKFFTNTFLLMYMGEGDKSFNKSIYAVLGVLVSLVVICTVAVIYNAFHISVLERMKQFGVLRSIGASPKQIRKIVFKEASILGIIGIPIGLILGVGGLKILFILIGSNEFIKDNNVVTSVNILLISTLVGFIAVYLSAFIPSVMASRVSPLDAIRNSGNASKEKIKRRRGILSKILNIEISMAHKNIRRNKKRFRITTFSVAISVLLFIVFTSFVNLTLNVKKKPNEDLNISYIIAKKESKQSVNSLTQEEYNKVKQIDGIDKTYKTYYPLEINAVIPLDKMNNNYIENKKCDTVTNGKKYNVVNAEVQAYDSDSLSVSSKYLKSGVINEDTFDNNGVIVLLANSFASEKLDKKINTDIADLKVGDEIILDNEGITKVNKAFPKKYSTVNVKAVLEISPFDSEYMEGGIKIITSEQAFNNIVNNIDKRIYENNYKTKLSEDEILGMKLKLSEDADREKIKIKLKSIEENNSTIKVVDVEAQIKKQKDNKNQAMLFLYGFVAVISLIGSVNIINTISTNIILRKREFSTLQAVGMTMGQINKMVMTEGVLYGFLGSIYGLIVGIPLSYLLYRTFTFIEVSWTIPWVDISIAVSGAILIGLISIIAPLNRIKEQNVIEGIRMEV